MKSNIKKMRLRQLYAQGLSMAQIAARFVITQQAVSKLLNLKEDAGLRQQHATCRNLDKELIFGKSQPRIRKCVQELYAQGMRLVFIVERLGISRQAVSEMNEGDVELERRHAARVALDRKLIAEERVTVDDFYVDNLDAPPVGGKERAHGAEAGDEEDEERRTSTEIATKNTTDTATSQQPEIQPSKQPEECGNQAADSSERIVKLVIEQVCADHECNRNQFASQERSPQVDEAREEAMFIAVRVTGLSFAQLGGIFGCDSSIVQHAYNEVEPIFITVPTRRDRILRIEASLREHGT